MIPKPKKKKKKNRAAKHKNACRRYCQSFVDKHGYQFCELCKRSDQYFYSVHHVFSAGQYSGHAMLHDDINLMLLCHECHTGIEENSINIDHIKEKLTEIFK